MIYTPMLAPIMKKLLTLCTLLLVNKIFACVCMPTSLLDLTAKADFIATANILEISQDRENNEYYNLEIEVAELFKGQRASTLRLRGNMGSCSLYTPKNTEWLIFAYEGKDGELTFGYCSGTIQLDKYSNSEIYSRKYSKEELEKLNDNYRNKIKLKTQLLRYLKNQKIEPSNAFDLRIYFVDDCLKLIRGFEEKTERFSLYELTINSDLSIEKVLALKEFENEKLNLSLANCIKNGITVYKNANEKSIPKKTKIVIGLRYYPAKGKRESFVSKRTL